jgi:hypothetical protein
MIDNFQQVAIQRDFAIDGYRLYLGNHHHGSMSTSGGIVTPPSLHYVSSFMIVTVPDDGSLMPNVPSISGETAQRLLQALWDAGLRPNKGEGSAGHVAAIERHLEDMRRLAFAAHLPEPTPDRPKITTTGLQPDF